MSSWWCLYVYFTYFEIIIIHFEILQRNKNVHIWRCIFVDETAYIHAHVHSHTRSQESRKHEVISHITKCNLFHLFSCVCLCALKSGAVYTLAQLLFIHCDARTRGSKLPKTSFSSRFYTCLLFEWQKICRSFQVEPFLLWTTPCARIMFKYGICKMKTIEHVKIYSITNFHHFVFFLRYIYCTTLFIAILHTDLGMHWHIYGKILIVESHNWIIQFENILYDNIWRYSANYYLFLFGQYSKGILNYSAESITIKMTYWCENYVFFYAS